MSAETGSTASLPSLVELAKRFPAWAKANVRPVVITTVVSGVFAYVVNVWLMAVRYQGFAAPAGDPPIDPWAKVTFPDAHFATSARSVGTG